MRKTTIILIASILSFSITSYQNIPNANANAILRILQSLQKLSKPVGKLARPVGKLPGTVRRLPGTVIKLPGTVRTFPVTIDQRILPNNQETLISDIEYIKNKTNSNLETVEIAAESIISATKKLAYTINKEEISIEKKKIDYELGRIAKLTLDTEEQRNYIAHITSEYSYNGPHNNSKSFDDYNKTVNNNYHEIIKIYYNMMLITTVISTYETLKSLEYEPSDTEIKEMLYDSASEKNDKHLKILKENEIAKMVGDGIQILKNEGVVASFRDELGKNGVS